MAKSEPGDPGQAGKPDMTSGAKFEPVHRAEGAPTVSPHEDHEHKGKKPPKKPRPKSR
jgi:hypothetical protein